MSKIIYIMGTGRSGTTILDVIISNNTGIIGAGEVTHMINSEILSSEICACGKHVTQCDAWGKVCEEFTLEELKDSKALVRSIEAHSSFFLVALNLIDKRKLARYKEINERLFKSICNGRAEIIVDSSKYAARALLLAKLFPERVQVVSLTRSAEGIINAFRKEDMEQPSKTLVATFLYYIYALTCFFICRIILKNKVIEIQYEKLAADPVSSIYQIEKASGISLRESIELLDNDDYLLSSHIVVGNRLRKKEKIKFSKSNKQDTLQGMGMFFAFFMNGYRFIMGFNKRR